MKIVKQLELIEQVDQLIRLNATGTPDQFASRLRISKTKLYRIIAAMRDMNAPVRYDDKLFSFIYEHHVEFTFGFKPNIDKDQSFTGFRKKKKTRKKTPLRLVKNVKKVAC